ncbi:hypothetical protein [Chitinophaga sancti]|uniref:hypothetical protein n=1 Tax=Chitinophaga sancti TaxID=1004 RepID=UPI003F7A0256
MYITGTCRWRIQVQSLRNDQHLDPLNQCLFSMLHMSCLNWQPDANIRKEKLAKLKAEASS